MTKLPTNRRAVGMLIAYNGSPLPSSFPGVFQRAQGLLLKRVMHTFGTMLPRENGIFEKSGVPGDAGEA